MVGGGYMAKVMVSYRRIDGQQEFAYKVEEALRNAGIDTWIDVRNIPMLSNWESEIFNAIKQMDYVLLCLSPEYFESEICLLECYVSRGYSKKLLPIVVPNNTPDEWDNIYHLAQQYEATHGLEHLNFLHFDRGNVVGLPEDQDTMIQRIIDTIRHPQPSKDYDVTVSFKWQHAEFATRIADDLNAAGIETFIYSRHLDVGVDWRAVSWNAMLKAHLHAVILSPEIGDSVYIAKEVLLSRTKNTTFVPIIAESCVNDVEKMNAIIEAINKDDNLKALNKIQWLAPDKGYDAFIANLIPAIQQKLDDRDK